MRNIILSIGILSMLAGMFVSCRSDDDEKKIVRKKENPQNPKKYWGLHTNGKFFKFIARDEAVSMAIHDRLFYLLSEELNITLTEEEIIYLNNSVEDFWSDLTDEGKEKRLGIKKQDIYNAMEQIAIAEKSQTVYAAMNGLDYEDYDFSKEEFISFLEDYEYEVNENILKRLDFGNITIER